MRPIRHLLIWTTITLFATGARTEIPQLEYSWRGAHGTSRDLQSIAYGNGLFVTVGSNGVILLSEDGENWRRARQARYGDFVKIIHGNNAFIAYSGSFNLFPHTSPDGEVWNEHPSVPVRRNVKFNGDYFTGLQDSRTNVYTSPNGLDWTVHSTVPNTFTNLLIFDRGPGFHYAGNNRDVFRSVDLVTWTASSYPGAQPAATESFAGREYIGGRFGAVISSPDGHVWTQDTELNFWIASMASNDEMLVATGQRRIAHTANGTDWLTIEPPSMEGEFTDVTWGVGRWMAVGTGGAIFSSTDAIRWTKHGDSGIPLLQSVAAGPSEFVSVGSGGSIRTSATGVSWKTQVSPVNTALMKVIHGSERYLAVGAGGKALTSKNGRNWTASFVGEERLLTHAAHGNGLFMAAAENMNMVWTSPDGLHWEKRTHPNLGAVHSLAFGNGLFVAGRRNGRIHISTDGESWEELYLGENTSDLRAFFINDTFYLYDHSTVFTSVNGTDWQKHPLTGFAPTDITFYDGYFRASRWRQDTSPIVNHEIIVSADGFHWEPDGTGWPLVIRSVASRNGVFVAVGDDGAILQAGATDAGPEVKWFKPETTKLIGLGETVVMAGTASPGEAPIARVELWANGELVGTASQEPFEFNWTPQSPGRHVLFLRVMDEDGGEEFSDSREERVALLPMVQTHPHPPGEIIQDFAHGNGLIVGVGDGPTILVSEDGSNWLRQSLPTTNNIHSVAFGDGRFIAVDGQQYHLESEDGFNWKKIETPQSPRLRLVRYVNNRFIGGGVTGVFHELGEAGLWRELASIDTSFSFVTSLIMYQGRYYATRSNSIFSSEDLLEWRRDLIAGNGVRVLEGDGLLMAVSTGKIDVSVDGSMWETVPIGTNQWIGAAAYGEGTYLAADSHGRIFVSQDARNWMEQPRVTTESARTATFANGQFVLSFGAGNLMAATDPADLRPAAQGPSIDLYAVAHGDNGFIAVGERGAFLYSLNARDWFQLPSLGTSHWRAVAYGGGKYVAVGQHGAIAMATDPLHWELQASPRDRQLWDVVWGGECFIATGEGGTVLRSTDGRNWELIPFAQTGFISALTHGPSGFLFSYSGNSFYLSSDGLNWAQLPVGSMKNPRVLASDGDRYFALSPQFQDLDAWTSTDAINWQRIHDAPISNLNRMRAHNGLLAAISVANSSLVLRAGNGDWFFMPPTTTVLRDLVFTNGMAVTVGDKGAVWNFGQPEKPWPAVRMAIPEDVSDLRPGQHLNLPVTVEGTVVNPQIRLFVNNRLEAALDGESANFQWTVPGYGDFSLRVEVWDGERRVAMVQDDGTAPFPAFVQRNPVSGSPPDNIVAMANGHSRLVGALNGFPGVVFSDDGVHWKRHLGMGEFDDIIFAMDHFIAVGRGAVFISEDGLEWEIQALPVNGKIHAMTYRNGVFVAVGENGLVLYSENALSWNVATPVSPKNLFNVAGGDSGFVATGDGGSILHSYNGQVWTEVSTGTGARLDSVTFGNGWYLAGSSSGLLFASTDGQNWETVSNPLQEIHGLDFVHGTFFASSNNGRVHAWTNQKEWRTINLPTTETMWRVTEDLSSRLLTIGRQGLIYQAAGAPETTPRLLLSASPTRAAPGDQVVLSPLMTEPDSALSMAIFKEHRLWKEITNSPQLVWTPSAFGLHVFRAEAILPDGNRVVSGSVEIEVLPSEGERVLPNQASGAIVGFAHNGDQTIAVTETGEVLHPANERDWELKGDLSLSGIQTILGVDGLFLAASGQQLAISPDGETWNVIQRPPLVANASTWFRAGTHFFAATGSSLARSTDGISWSQISLPAPVSSIVAGAYGNGRFVAVDAQGKSFHSTNASHWTAGGMVGSGLQALIFAEGVFIGVAGQALFVSETADIWGGIPTPAPFLGLAHAGRLIAHDPLGHIWESADGIQWLNASGQVVDPVLSITAMKDRFLIGGSFGVIFGSEDGSAWVREAPNLLLHFNSIAASPDRIVAVGNDGQAAISGDGFTWDPLSMAINGDIHRVRWLDQQFWAVGSNGALSVSSDGETWSSIQLPTNNDLRGIAAGMGCRVAVGDGGVILFGDRNGNWSRAQTPATANLVDVSFGNSGFVAIDSSGRILESADGWEWHLSQQFPRAGVGTVVSGPFSMIASDGAGLYWVRSASGEWLPTGTKLTAEPNQPSSSGHFIRNSFWTISGSDLLMSTQGSYWAVLPTEAPSGLRDLTHFANAVFAVGPGTEIRRFPLPDQEPVITAQPHAIRVIEGSSFQIKVWVNASLPITLDWTHESVSLQESERIRGVSTKELVVLDASPADAGVYQLAVSNLFGQTNSLPIEVMVDPLESYQDWLRLYFSEDDLMNPFITNPEAILTTDGLPNLVKYALGLDPRVTAPAGRRPTVQLTEENGERFLTISIRQAKRKSGTGIFPQVTGVLSNWPDDSSGTVKLGPSLMHPDGTQTTVHRDTTPVSASNSRFMRVKTTPVID